MSSLIGAGLFASVGVYSNIVRRLPAMARPYELVGLAVVGGAAGSAFAAWDEKNTAEYLATLEAYKNRGTALPGPREGGSSH